MIHSMSDDSDTISFRSEEPLTIFQRFRVLIGYDLSDEAKLELACRAHLDAKRAVEDSQARLKASEQQQMFTAEKLQRLSADRANGALIRQAKDSMLDGMSAFSVAKKEYEASLAACEAARERQKDRFARLAQLEGQQVALEVVQESLQGWWADSMDDGGSWWNG